MKIRKQISAFFCILIVIGRYLSRKDGKKEFVDFDTSNGIKLNYIHIDMHR